MSTGTRKSFTKPVVVQLRENLWGRPLVVARRPMNELRVLSGGAVQKGLENVARAFHEETGHRVTLTFATAPVLRSTVEEDAAPFDMVIAPVPLAENFAKRGLTLAGSSAIIGSVKAGVVVREGVPGPDISTAEALKKEILASESLVFNEGSSGIYVEEMLDRLGVAAEAKTKIIRLPNAEAVMMHLARSKTAKEIGFGQITAIRLYAGRGVKWVGPLPPEIGNTTTYAAGVLAGTKTLELAEQLIRFLVAPSVQVILRATGIEC